VTGWRVQPAAPSKHGGRRLLVLLALGLAVVVIPIGAWIGAQVVYGLLPGVESHLTADVRLDGHLATVAGETNLPDGALIAYSVFPSDSNTQASDSDSQASVNGTATVRDGRFAFDADISQIPAGPADVYLSFGMGWGVDEPLNVVLTYGPYGERLAGDQV